MTASPSPLEPEARPVREPRGSRLGGFARDVLEAILLAVLLFFGLRLVVQNTVVEGSSMHPNFVDQEHLLVNKLAYRNDGPERGDVVVFKSESDDKEFIKRVIGLPGETVRMEDGRVFVGGQLLEEPWAPRFDASDFGPYVVPEGHYFVLGDNRANSNDSRVFGTPYSNEAMAGPAVPASRIVGEAWLTVWPPDRLGFVPEPAVAVETS